MITPAAHSACPSTPQKTEHGKAALLQVLKTAILFLTPVFQRSLQKAACLPRHRGWQPSAGTWCSSSRASAPRLCPCGAARWSPQLLIRHRRRHSRSGASREVQFLLLLPCVNSCPKQRAPHSVLETFQARVSVKIPNFLPPHENTLSLPPFSSP